MRDTLKPCVSTPHCDPGSLQNPQHKPRAPATKCRATSPLNASLQTRFSTSSAKLLPYPISHQTLMDLMWESIITPILFSAPFCSFFGPVMDPQRLPPGPPSSLSSLRCPSSGSSSALVLFTVVKRHSLNVRTQNKRQWMQCNGVGISIKEVLLDEATLDFSRLWIVELVLQWVDLPVPLRTIAPLFWKLSNSPMLRLLRRKTCTAIYKYSPHIVNPDAALCFLVSVTHTG